MTTSMLFREMRELLCNHDNRKSNTMYQHAKSVGEVSLQDELDKVDGIVDAELNCFEANQATDEEITKRLLFLLHCDLLPGQQGEILQTKENGEYFESEFTKQEYKTCAWIFIIALNLFCLFYVFNFALQATKEVQAAWCYTVLLWFVMDVFFTSTAMVLLQHVALPMVIMDDIDHVKIATLKEMHNLSLDEQLEKSGTASSKKGVDKQLTMYSKAKQNFGFNAAEWCFVSTRLAHKFPHLPISRLILRFHTPFPRHAFRPTHQVTDETFLVDAAIVGLRLLGHTLVMFFSLVLINVPEDILSGCIEAIVAIIVTATMFMVFSLLSNVPLFVGILFILVLISAAFYFRGKYLSTHRQEKLVQSAQDLLAMSKERVNRFGNVLGGTAKFVGKWKRKVALNRATHDTHASKDTPKNEVRFKPSVPSLEEGKGVYKGAAWGGY